MPKPPPPSPQCVACKFWAMHPNNPLKGDCHRNPPVEQSVTYLGMVTAHVETDATDWCGEFLRS